MRRLAAMMLGCLIVCVLLPAVIAIAILEPLNEDNDHDDHDLWV